MSYFKLTVNGKVEHDGELDQWAQSAPDFVQNAIKPGMPPQQWLKLVAIVFSDCMMIGESAEIVVTHTPVTYEIKVKQKR